MCDQSYSSHYQCHLYCYSIATFRLFSMFAIRQCYTGNFPSWKLKRASGRERKKAREMKEKEKEEEDEEGKKAEIYIILMLLRSRML